MEAISGLRPQGLWRHFQEISRIPRESGNEAAVARHIMEAAQRCGLECRSDDAGNVFVRKPGARGCPAIALQSHMDMVCEQTALARHDFGRDPIRLVRDGDWMRAENTTLGADNGLGVAAMLAVMEDTALIHPTLELIFTTAEETGLNGAKWISRGSFTANTLINLDSEEEGCLIIGCAGGMDTRLVLETEFMSVPEDTCAARLRVSGLKGGHSGVDIHRGRGNAVKLLNRFLLAVSPAYGFHLVSLKGGSKHNAIPREAEAVVHVQARDMEALRQEAVHWNGIISSELEHFDDTAVLTIDELDQAAPRVLAPDYTRRVMNLVQSLPHGPIKADPRIEGTVVTSTNLAICGFEGDDFTVLTSHRSTIVSALHDISSQAAAIGELAGCTVIHGSSYPSWRPSLSSPILDTCTRVYRALRGTDPLVRVVHAGLECAVIGERIKGLDMISFGPAVEEAHTPHERANIASVERFWEYLTALLRVLAGKDAVPVS